MHLTSRIGSAFVVIGGIRNARVAENWKLQARRSHLKAGSTPSEDSSGGALILRNRVLTRPCRLQMNGVPQHEQVVIDMCA